MPTSKFFIITKNLFGYERMKIFIEEQQEVNELLQTLESTGEYVGFERELLICPESGQKWEKYFFEFEDNSDGVGIRKYPVPSIEDVIEVALFTEYEDEADGAAACLIDYENEGDFREPLIVRLEKIVPQLPYERFELIYNRAELNNDANKRSIVGKHHLEITKDYEYFLSLAQRANELISRYKNK